MIIDYIYLFDKINKKEVELNLSHKFFYKFEREKSILKKGENEYYVNNLFGESIWNINAIVGKNGAGKTRTLKQIINILRESEITNYDFLLYVYDEYRKEDIFISNNKKIYMNGKWHNSRDIKRTFMNTISFYYSNVFDGNNIFDTSSNVINLSTNSILNEYNNKKFSLKQLRDNETHEHIEFAILYKELLKIQEYLTLPTEIDIKLDFNELLVDNEEIIKYFKSQGINLRFNDISDETDKDYYKSVIENSLLYDYLKWLNELVKVLTVNKQELLNSSNILGMFDRFWEDSSNYLDFLKGEDFEDYDNDEEYKSDNDYETLKEELFQEASLMIDINYNEDYEFSLEEVNKSLYGILERFNISLTDINKIIEIFDNIFFEKGYDQTAFKKDEIEFLETIVYDLEGDFQLFHNEYYQWLKESLENDGVTLKLLIESKKKILESVLKHLDIIEYRRDITREIELKDYDNEFNDNYEEIELFKMLEENTLEDYYQYINRNKLKDFDNESNDNYEEIELYRFQKELDSKGFYKEVNDNYEAVELIILEEENLLSYDDLDNLGLNIENVKKYLAQLIEEKINYIQSKIKLALKVVDSINSNNTILLNNINLEAFLKKFDSKGMFIFNWRNLSSGEISFIGFLSRLFKAKKMVSRRQDIILFIDEGELYFHPQWQKNYINLLVKSLKEIFRENKIQVILTSHSPFIVADLPHYAVQALGDKGFSDVLVELGLNKTFAANIHDLYTNAFFIKGGLTGEFAKNKVNEWLEEIMNYSDLAFNQYDYYLKAFNLIGEPLVRERCLAILDQKRIDYLTKVERGKKQGLIEEYKKMIQRLESEISEEN
ncbi:AAA family ATPase [Lysinibacillus sp. RSDA_15]|uniref:AAA family ATPase n=1 Tax=Lysinibacillus sp. RSDA_15 TaxID=3391421 RepID=UPI003A4DABF6